MRTGKVSERVKSVVSLEGDIGLIPPRAKRQRELAEFLSSRGEADLTALREEFGSAVKGLEERGMLHIEKRRVFRDPYERLQKSAPLRPLTPAQEAAVHTIERTQKTVTLIHGVTGSGKTEIYLTLIAHALEEGKSAVFLVPEISLTPQMFAQLRARFQMSCAILHSGLSAGERFDEWERLRSGEAKIAIGARSAVFAPLEHIGVIVIDEEHDGSYSSERAAGTYRRHRHRRGARRQLFFRELPALQYLRYRLPSGEAQRLQAGPGQRDALRRNVPPRQGG